MRKTAKSFLMFSDTRKGENWEENWWKIIERWWKERIKIIKIECGGLKKRKISNSDPKNPLLLITPQNRFFFSLNHRTKNSREVVKNSPKAINSVFFPNRKINESHLLGSFFNLMLSWRRGNDLMRFGKKFLLIYFGTEVAMSVKIYGVENVFTSWVAFLELRGWSGLHN